MILRVSGVVLKAYVCDLNLSGSINAGSYNNALQGLAPAYAVQYFNMSDP
jgi:hypothetical protein